MANVKINELPSGSFNAKVYDYTTPEGKRKYKSITAPTKGEVKRQVAVFLAEREAVNAARAAECALPPEAVMTVGEAIDKYIESKNNVLSPSTVREYKGIRRNLPEALLSMNVKSVTSGTLQTFVNDEALKSSPKTVRNKHGLLISALKNADIHLEPAAMPSKVKPDIVIPEKETVVKLLDCVRDTKLDAAVHLAAICGMRRSEICAVRWDDVDFERETLTVRAAMVQNEDLDFVIKGTKTTAGKRIIRVFAPALEALKRTPRDGDFVVSIKPSAITDHWRDLLKRWELPFFRFHDLRHYAVSVMLALGMPKSYIADYVGHETERMIDEVYGHILHSTKSEYEDKINKFYSNAT